MPVVQAIEKELQIRKNYLNEPLQSVYFGGGTPSILDSTELERLFEAIHQHYQLTSDVEISLEANPDDLSLEKLRMLKDVGVNRLSIGIQSFNDQILKYLHRAHTADDAKKCIENAKNEGFNNLNVDLIFAIPDQTEAMLMDDLRSIAEIDPEHVSIYGLTIEPRTVFGNWSKKGKLTPTEEETGRKHYLKTMDFLVNSGYEHYEISNYAKKGYHSRHNSNYWKQKPYLGVGPGAHSYNLESRQFNVANNAAYVKNMTAGVDVHEIEALSLKDQVNDFLLTTIRTSWGCDLNMLREKYQYDVLQRYGNIIKSMLEANLIQISEDQVLTLNTEGKLIADEITAQLLWA